MEILIIASDIGKTAPGIVYERLIMGLSNYHQLTIITANNNSTLDLNNVKHIKIVKYFKTPYFIYKPIVSILGINPLDILWANNSSRLVQKLNKRNFDLVFCFISNHNFAPLIAGFKASRKLNCKLAVYSVDAIPAIGWPEQKKYYLKVEKLMQKFLKDIDALFSSNLQMLNYQLLTFQPKRNLITDVVYNPHIDGFKEYPIQETQVNNFLYTGKIYGLRNAKYVLEAFEKLLIKHKNSKLIFVEAGISQQILSKLRKETRDNIEFHPFTTNLELFYTNATALIDIDAELENDVFMSSKITNYININRIIISESSQNSPSQQLFKNIDSVFQCLHNTEHILKAMEKAIELKQTISYDDRKNILSHFSLNNVIKHLNNSLNKL